MILKIENIEKNVRKLVFELDTQEFNEGLNEAFKRNVRSFNVPGFRKGKAPRHIVERYYGVEVLYDDAINYLCPKYYEQALKEKEITPVSKPELDIEDIKKGEPFVFSALVTIEPDVVLGEYKGLEVKCKDVLVTEEDVEQELQRLADRNSRLVPVEGRAAQTDDTVNIDFEGFVDGEPFEGGKAEDFLLVLGSNRFIPGFEEQIIGASLGDEVDVNVAFPEDYHAEELKGKPALFKVKVNEIKEKELPEIDDEFAQDVSEFETLDEFKTDIRAKIRVREEDEAKEEFKDAVLSAVAERAEVEVPEVMIERQLEYNEKIFKITLEYQGIDVEKYLESLGDNRGDFEKDMRLRSKNEVISRLIVKNICKLEKIEASQEDLDEEIAKRASRNKKDIEEYKAQMSEDDTEDMKESLSYEKTVDFLVTNAVKI